MNCGIKKLIYLSHIFYYLIYFIINNKINNKRMDNNKLLIKKLTELRNTCKEMSIIYSIDRIKGMIKSQKSVYDILNQRDIHIHYCIRDLFIECFLKENPEYFLKEINYLKLSDFDTSLFQINKSNQTLTYKEVTVNIKDIKDIKSEEIKQYYIKQIPESFLTQYNTLKLSDFDTSLFQINKQNKTFTYNDITINIKDIISQEIREYCIKQIPESFLTQYNNLKLSDFDTTLFQINKQNQTLTYKDFTVNIKDIQSEEIKKYFIDKLQRGEDKDICKYILDTIQFQSNRVTINLELYKSLKSSQNKLYIIKYVFSKYRDLTQLIDTQEIFKIFIDYPSYLIDLLKQMISTNNKNLEYILKNKPIQLDTHEYKKLQDYAFSAHLFELTNILTIYESQDYLLNDNKVDFKDNTNSLKDELWN